MRRTHWHGEHVDRIQTTLARLPSLLPVFERRDFGRNRFHDVISLKAQGERLPVGLVSKRYALVQHADAVRGVIEEAGRAGIDPDRVPARLLISEYGTRIALTATLPDEYSYTPDDGHKVALTFELYNSVDGSVPLLAAVGWFRFICGNGLVIGSTTARVRQRHSAALRIEDVSTVLGEGMRTALEDRNLFEDWVGTEVDSATVAAWIDGPLTKAWGPSAAARVNGIVTTGRDGTPATRPKTLSPSQRVLTRTAPVPGADEQCQNAYGIAQALSWVASHRHNVAERVEWRDDIPALIDTLATPAPPRDDAPLRELLASIDAEDDEETECTVVNV